MDNLDDIVDIVTVIRPEDVTADDVAGDVAEDDEPEWELMSVLPMSQCRNKKYNSKIWDYFGQLMRESICVDNRNFYCSICFENRKFKQYSATTGTSNLYFHVKSCHGVVPEKSVPKQRTEPAKLDPSKVKYIETSDMSFTDKYNSFHESFVKNDDSISQIPITEDSELIRSVEASTADVFADYDRLFILSLVKEFRKVPEENRLDCRSAIIEILRKYQKASSPTQEPTQFQENVEEYITSVEGNEFQSYTIIAHVDDESSNIIEMESESLDAVEYVEIEEYC